MSNKLEKLNNLLALMQNDTITPAEVEKFLVMVLKVIKDSKENMEALSQESLSQMKEALEYISSEHQELLSIIDGKNSKLQKDITAKIEEAKKLLKEVKSVKPVHGKDGKDADEEVIVDKVLGRIKMPEIDIESPESILEKLNALDGDFKLNSSLITLPEDTMIEIDGLKRQIKNGLGGSTARNLYQLQDVQVSNIQDNDILQYNTSNNTWRNVTPQSIENVLWGEITGTITNQTDLINYIDSKIATVDTLNEISLLSNTTAKSLYQMTSGADVEFRASDTTTLFYLDETNKLTGFGTNAPNNLIHAVKTSDGNVVTQARFQNYAPSTNTGSAIDFVNTTSLSTGAHARFTALRTNRATNGDTAFIFSLLSGGSLTERARLLDNGNFGLGITVPYTRLSVQKDTVNSRVYFPIGIDSSTQSKSVLGSGTGILFSRSSGATATGAIASYADGTASGVGIWGTPSTTVNADSLYTTATPNLYVNASGNVGIGTVLPLARFHVQGAGTSNPAIDGETSAVFSRTTGAGTNSQISIISGTTGNAVLRFGDTASEGRGQQRYNNNTDGFEWYTAATVQAYLSSAGQFSLGATANASAILQADSTTQGFLPPRMTTTQKNAISSPATGLVVYDTTLNKLAVYTGAGWETVTSL